MDGERKIEKIEIEADVCNNFDDVIITTVTDAYYFQMKDYGDISLDNLSITKDSISIKWNPHILSENINVLFFKNINITPNCEVLGFSAFKFSKVYIVSLSRLEIDNELIELYKSNLNRKSNIEQFFSECLDKRKFIISRKNLPTINVFSTQLLEHTINIGKKHLEVESILIIEGKPGVGKSHFVNCLKEEYINSIIYRFWISSQDKDSQERLKYNSFISDFSKKLFDDYLHRNEEEIIQKLHDEQQTVIIDGLDHIENYNSQELEKYIEFIVKLKEKCKTIVLTRPLNRKLKWSKYILGNWNNEQTKMVLNELYHISNYSTVQDIFSITDGYPILVRFIAEHYKKYNEIPKLTKLENIDNYYEQIVNKEKGKQALSLFLCSRSFFMKSEIVIFLDEELSIIVNEFVEEHPYLFEIRLNRISLFHDSFITYLRKQGINYSNTIKIVNECVYHSVMDGEKRFLSRFSFFDLEQKMKKNIIKKYSSIEIFKDLVKDVIDFEAIQTFYFQIRETLNEISPNALEITNYYDLSLIINIVNRDHVSTINTFLYTYVKSLLFNGFNEEDITSSSYLFAMLYYVQINDATLLYNTTSDDIYGTEYFYEELINDIQEESSYFEKHKKPLSPKQIKKLLEYKSEYEQEESITLILENLYIHKSNKNEFPYLFECIIKYMNAEEKDGLSILENILYQYNVRDFFASRILKDAKSNILALGKASDMNDYKNLSLNDFIVKYQDKGSFDLWVEILNYLRLSLHENKKIDISSIALFWTKYYQRKDYSVFNIDVALTVFEERDFVNMLDSCNLINSIQDVSEKGYRALLAEYIVLHPPDIIQFLIKNFKIEDLYISWLDLPSEYINVFSDNIFQSALKKVLGYHRSNKEIDCNEVINVFDSNRKDELKYVLNLTRYKLRISKFHPDIKKLKEENIDLIEFIPDDKDFSYKENSLSRYNQGILNFTNKDFILENRLKSFEVAGFSNGNYSALADLDIYKLFEEGDIRKNIKPILYNAILGKIKSINSFYDLYYFLGNVPKLVVDYKVEDDIEELFNSFTSFLDLSMLNLNHNNWELKQIKQLT